MIHRPAPKLARSFVEYLDRRLGPHSGVGPEFTYHCHACIDRLGSESSKKKLALNIERRRGQCFRCEFKFRDFEHLFRSMNGGFITPEERILLREDPPIIVDDIRSTVLRLLAQDESRTTVQTLRAPALPREYVRLSRDNVSHPAYRHAHSYLSGRGVDLRTTRRFKIGFCATGEYRGYLIFPVYQGGEMVYWTNRFAGKSRLKSKNPPKRDGFYSREHCLLNYDRVVGRRVVALVEGPFDCMAPRHAIAMLGRVMSRYHAALIAALVPHGLEELVMLLDPGTGRDMDKIRATLVDVVPRVTMLNLGHGDPASRRDELVRLMRTRREPTLLDRIQSRFGAK